MSLFKQGVNYQRVTISEPQAVFGRRTNQAEDYEFNRASEIEASEVEEVKYENIKMSELNDFEDESSQNIGKSGESNGGKLGCDNFIDSLSDGDLDEELKNLENGKYFRDFNRIFSKLL